MKIFRRRSEEPEPTEADRIAEQFARVNDRPEHMAVEYKPVKKRKP